MKYHMVLAVEFFIVQGALFSDSDEDNNSQYWKTRYLSGSDYGSHYNLNHDSSKVNIHDHEVPSRTLFSWGPNDANIIKKNKTPSFFFENEQNPMSMDAMSQRNESNIWWPWSNYEEWASSRKRDSLVNNIRVIQSNKTNSPKSSSEEKKKKKKRKKKKKNKKNKKTSADTEPQQERELGSSSSKNTFFLTENYNVIESSPKSAKKMGLSVGDEDGYFNNENIPRHGKHKSVLTWKQDPAVVEKTPRGGWDNNEMDNEIHSRYNYQDAIPFKDSKNTLLDKIKKHRNVDSFIKGYSSRNFTDDINECLIDNGGCEGLCINTPGSYKCHCPDGFKLDISKCIDVNECLLRNGHGPCQGKCINQWGSYKCSCEDIPGTRLAKDGHTCEDVDECREGTAGCSHDCVNTVGSAFCLCPNGFMLGMDWKTCTDIDECAMPELQDERCIDRCENTIGSYRCL